MCDITPVSQQLKCGARRSLTSAFTNSALNKGTGCYIICSCAAVLISSAKEVTSTNAAVLNHAAYNIALVWSGNIL